MSGARRRFLGLCIPPLAFCLVDTAVTLAGQTAEYWSGAYGHVDEGSPTFHQLLAIHPLAFAAGILVWMGIFVAFILVVSDTLALISSVAVTLAHTAGAATWILWRFKYGYQACNGLFLLAAIALGIGIRLGWQAVPSQGPSFPSLSAARRWSLAAFLFAIAVYLFLWPRSIQ